MKKILLTFTLILSSLLFSQEKKIKFGSVTKEELNETSYPEDKNADASYLVKKRHTYFNFDPERGFNVTTDYHERIKVYSKEGLEYATKLIKYYTPKSGEKEKISSLKAYTFNIENGKIEKEKLSRKNIFEEELNKYRSQKKMTFPKVKVGSVIDLKYSIISPYYDIRTLNFQYTIPVKKIDYKITIPEYFVFNKHSKGYYSIPLEETKKRGSINFTTKNRQSDGYSTKTSFSNREVEYIENVYVFKQKNIPAINNKEPYVGNINNYRGGIDFELSGTRFPNSTYKNYATTWNDVCKTIYQSESFGAQLNKHNYYKNDLNNILSSAKNNLDKILLIYNFVKLKVKWNNYNGIYTEKGVKKAYKEGVGNVAEINLMLTSMLRSAGLSANPVLTSTKNNGIPLFPTIDGFNYVITKVNMPDGKYVLLDATDKYATPNMLPYRTLNWNGTEIRKDGSSTSISLVPFKHSSEKNILYTKIIENSIEGMLRRTYNSHSAMYFRSKNNLKKEEEVVNNIENKYNIEIDNIEIKNKFNTIKPINQNIRFTSDNHIEEINGKLYFSPMFFFAQKENPFKSNERNFPVDFIVPWSDQFLVSITIPDGYTIESFPKDTSITLPENLGVFAYKISTNENKINLTVVKQVNSPIIPAQYYSQLKEFYKQLVEKENEKIVLIKK